MIEDKWLRDASLTSSNDRHFHTFFIIATSIELLDFGSTMLRQHTESIKNVNTFCDIWAK